MTHSLFLTRIRRLFTSGPSEHLDRIADAIAKGTLSEPGFPMSDQELARAIREFRAFPVTDWTIAKLGKRLAEASPSRDR